MRSAMGAKRQAKCLLVLMVNCLSSTETAPLTCCGNSGRVVPAVRHARPIIAAAGKKLNEWLAPETSSPRPGPIVQQLRLRGGHRLVGFKRRDNIDKVRTSRRIHSIARPRNERKRAERRARLQEEVDNARNASADDDDIQDVQQPPPANRDLFRRNMGEWVVEIQNFKKEHPAVYEEEFNTRVDAEARYMIRQWQETVQMPEDDEEELDKRTRHPDWIKMRGISHYNLGMCHDTGYGVGMSQRSPTTAFQHYLASAELGHVEAMCCAGSCLMYGKGVHRNVEEAVEWYVRAAMEGSVDGSFDAMFNLGMCFRKGIGRPQDPVAALKWFRAAAKYKHPDAMYAVAMSHLHGYGGAAQDAEKAVKELVKICDRYHHRAAQLSLAKCFVLGVGVETDEEMGLKMSMLALDKDEEAVRDAGMCKCLPASFRAPLLHARTHTHAAHAVILLFFHPRLPPLLPTLPPLLPPIPFHPQWLHGKPACKSARRDFGQVQQMKGLASTERS